MVRLRNTAVAGRRVVLPVDGLIMEFDARGLSLPIAEEVASVCSRVPGYEVVELPPDLQAQRPAPVVAPVVTAEHSENPFAPPQPVRRGRR